MAELARVGVTLAVPRLSEAAASELLRSAAGDHLSTGATGAVIERSARQSVVRLGVRPDHGAVGASRRRARGRARGRRGGDRASAGTAAGSSGGDAASAAIAGNPFSVETVARIDGTRFAESADGLETAVAVGFVARVDHRTDFTFSHLVRDVVLGGIDSAGRAELHLRVAALFEERLAVDGSLHAVVADHLELAGPGHAEAAAAHWEQAAQGAGEQQALALLDRSS